MKILNWIFGSFFRTLGRFLFYLLISFATVLLFNGFFVSNVSALTYSDLENFTISTSGQFVSLNSPTSYTNRGYSIVTVGDVTYALPSGEPFTYGTYGGAVVQCDIPFVKDNFYALTYYFISSPGQYLHPDYSAYPYQVGVGYSATTTYPNFAAAGQSGSQQQICDDSFSSNVGNCLNSFTTIFKAPNTNTCVALKFSSSTHDVTTSEIGFVGYRYTSLGSNASSQDINNALSEQNTFINSLFTTTNDKIDSGFSNISQQQQETNNKLDETNENLNKVDESINDVNDSLNNSNIDDPEGAFNQFESYLPENGVITDLITLPISLFQRVLTSVNGSCSQYNLGNLLGTDLILPCINVSNYIGSTLWNVIDILFSGLFVLAISKKMIKVFNNFTSMEEGDIL